MRKIIPLLLMAMVVTACTNVDCPLNNLVRANFILKSQNEKLEDTITVSAIRSALPDTVLFNRGINISNLQVPVSYAQDVDRFQIQLRDSLDNIYIDTLTITKTNQVHFEAVDCAPNYFHTITQVATTRHAIDSAVIKNPNIDYDTSKENIYIYFTNRSN